MNSTRFSRARRHIRWCWLVHSSVSQSANPTQTMSRSRRRGWRASGAMIPGAGACSLGAVQPGGPSSSPVLLEDLHRRFPRVAIAHDWLTIPGGSEQVVLELSRCSRRPSCSRRSMTRRRGRRCSPNAPVHASFLNRIPGAVKNYPKLLPLMNRAFRSFDLSGFDLVLSSSHACAKNVRAPSGCAARLLLPHADALRVGGGLHAR